MKRHTWMTLQVSLTLAVMWTIGTGPLAAADQQPAGQRQTALDLGDRLSVWPGAGLGDAQEFTASVEERETHHLTIGSSGMLELKTISGDVQVTAGSGGTATVEVIRRARGRTEADAQLGLSEVRAQVDHKGERAAVTAVYPTTRSRPPYSVDVSYVVTAPAGTRLTATSVSGDVDVRSIVGDLTAQSVSGTVTISGASRVTGAKSVSGDVTLRNVSNSGGLSASSVSGTVRLEEVTASQITAESVSGHVTLIGSVTERAVLKTVSGDVTYEGRLSRAGRYEFQTHSGDARVTTSGDVGFELQASTFSGALRIEPADALRDATRTNRSLRGTVGDGSAALVAATFSGSVTVETR